MYSKNSAQSSNSELNNTIAVTDPSPYPPALVHTVNSRWIFPLSYDIASQSGEMTAIYQYIYQHTLLQKTYPVIADTLVKIAIVEMHHLNMLSELIAALNGFPRAYSVQPGKRIPWNGCMPNYTTNVKQMLEADLAEEQDAVRIYTTQSKKITDPDISAVLSRIALDEQCHIKIFKNFLSELKH